MPKRKRTKDDRASGGAAPAQVMTEQERAAKLFADSVKTHEAADRADRERRREQAERAATLSELQAAKSAAAEQIKRLRAHGGTREKMADAEANYRLALAALQEFETGERPHWAPTLPTDAPDSPEAPDSTDAPDAPDAPEQTEPDPG